MWCYKVDSLRHQCQPFNGFKWLPSTGAQTYLLIQFKREIHNLKKIQPRNVFQNLIIFFEGKSNLRKMKNIPHHHKLMVIFYSDILMQKVALTDALAWNWVADISSHVPSDMKKGSQPKKVSRTHQCLNNLIRDIICKMISSNNTRGENIFSPSPLNKLLRN